MSAQSVTGTIQATIALINTLTGTAGSAKSQVTIAGSQIQVGPGTGAGLCNELWSNNLALLANTPQTLDLTALTGEGGRVVNFTAGKVLHVLNKDAANSISVYGNVLAAPSAPSVSNTGSGSSITNGTYQVAITWVTASGETVKSTASPVTTTGTQNIAVTIPSLPTGATGAHVYVSTTGGAISTATRQTLVPASAGTVTLTALITGVTYPSVNTAAYNAWAPWSNVPGYAETVTGGGCLDQQGNIIGTPLMRTNLTAAGWTVDSTHKLLTFDPGVNAVTVTVTIAGLTAP